MGKYGKLYSGENALGIQFFTACITWRSSKYGEGRGLHLGEMPGDSAADENFRVFAFPENSIVFRNEDHL